MSTSQPSTNRFGPRRLAFAYPHALLSQARRENTGHPRRWAPVRPHAFTGMIRSDWFMVGTRDVVTACRNVLSRSRRVLSMPLKRVPRRFRRPGDSPTTNATEYCGNTLKTTLEGVFEGYIPSLSENRRERHSRQPLEHNRPKRPQPYC